ncbi:MlaD family protein [Rhizobium sp. L1K21]|uniref:MlaD family protein n=1 Tax=Rhizobium sp. L1K21 TaxID=2954933 RepID=UPI0020923075|nr:MlaD family protein [Rhizobium sp. L1K21]MCO6186215.1 MCE family protein [Rhizobium sp. L1K21]
METKANYAIVGFFTVAVMAAAFAFVFWMSQYGRSGPTAELIVRIPGSANGLSVGSPVRFNGIQIGSVRSLVIDASDPEYSVAFTSVSADAPIYQSTKAILEVQGLTGSAYIELSGGLPSEQNILRQAEEKGTRAEILAEQSSVTNLLATADKILKKVDVAVGDIQEFATTAKGPLTRTVQNAEEFSQALADNSDGIDTFLKSVSSLSTTIEGLSGRLDSTLSAAEGLLKSVDTQKVDNILANVDKVTKDFADASGDVKQTLATFNKAAQQFETVGKQANDALVRVDKLLAAADPEKVGTAVDNAAVAIADAREAVASIKGVSDDVAKRREEIDRAIGDFTEMANKLNRSSNKVDSILTKVDNLLGSDDANSLFVQAREALDAYKKVADTLNARIGPIADNLQTFSGTGLRGVEALVQDTRRTMRSLENTISNFDRDPQRLLFGGDEVKTYDGRNRR